MRAIAQALPDAASCSHVTKSYGGHTVLADASLVVRPGETLGLVGTNGSGKTTLLRILAGLAWCDTGSVELLGQPLHRGGGVPDGIAVLFDPPGFLPEFTGYANVLLLARIRNQLGEADVTRWLERVGLEAAARKRVGKYSQGMQKRLGLAQAFMEQPRLILLDEPGNGLDVAGLELLVSLIRESTATGAAVVVATHHLDELAAVCTRTVRIAGGQLMEAASATAPAPES